MSKIAIGVLVSLLGFQLGAAELEWTTDFKAATAKAKKEKKMVLMNFTGSDWCGWCFKLRDEVFVTPEFQKYAEENLVLVEVDFPRKKKQSNELKLANQALQRQFGARGFPTIVVLSSEADQLWKHPGYLAGGPKSFIGKIEAAKKK